MIIREELAREFEEYVDSRLGQIERMLVTLARIPAPSGKEERRAEFCRDLLYRAGGKAFIDEALNVVLPIGVTGDADQPLRVVMAHSDVVFPDEDELPLSVDNDGKCIRCPGILDDTVNAVALLVTAEFLLTRGLVPRDFGLLLVVNSCEEGLGNLKGSRMIADTYGDRIKEFVSFDLGNCAGSDRAVGSERYLVEVRTEGGHSYGNFGNRNAIAYLSRMISELYEIKVSPKGRTTYNVGTVEGGTSVNTIAQYAQMLYEFRSDEKESLDDMREKFFFVAEKYRAEGLDVSVTTVGNRPCSAGVDENAMEELRARARTAAERYRGRRMKFYPASTDCNVPLSRGIPAVCVGFFDGGGSHTREEFFVRDSLAAGIKASAQMILAGF